MKSGGVLRVFQSTRDRQALRGRDLIENLGALFIRQVFENRYRIVGFDLAHAFSHGLRRQFLEDFLAYCIVHFRERREVKVDTKQFDQARPLVGLQRFQQRTEIGFVQFANQPAQRGDIGGIDRTSNFRDE
jgi:hypothetical protein